MKKYAIMIKRKDYEIENDELSEWTDYHSTLFDNKQQAEQKMLDLMNEELEDLKCSRGNNTDYFIDDVEHTISDSATGYDIDVAHYYIIEFNEESLATKSNTELYDELIESYIDSTDMQTLLKLARKILITMSETIEQQYAECNPEEYDENDFDNEDCSEIANMLEVLNDYIK